jgi:negative regulator of sigma E activity
MSEETLDPAISALEERSRALFEDSVANLDMRTRSRLTQARHAALAAADASARRPWLMRMPVWASAVGVTAAAVLGVALWVGGPLSHQGQLSAADTQSKFEDLDIIASSDESSGDAMDMLQDDIDFYDWADKAASNGPTA